MSCAYACGNEARRDAVRAARGSDGLPLLNGIDYLEVISPDQRTLDIFFIHPLPGEPDAVPAATQALQGDNCMIEGGVRIKGIGILDVNSSGNRLRIRTAAAGDFSTYTLRLTGLAGSNEPPAGFDPRLASIDFSFKSGCPGNFDCQPAATAVTSPAVEPPLNYLAKDYPGFRQLMLDRLSTLMPEWRERNPADLQMMLVELLAHVGDSLSYYQDAVATEAYLGTARQRISVRRHARLLDYYMHEGCNARAWVCFEVEAGGAADGAVLPRGTPLLTHAKSASVAVQPDDLLQIVQAEAPEIFETMHAVTLRAGHNQMHLYTWSGTECCLPAGATQATLLDRVDGSGARLLNIVKNDVLIFEETVSPATGLQADADTSHRHAVRINSAIPLIDPLTATPLLQIEWHAEDALPRAFSTAIRRSGDNGQPETIVATVVRGNAVLADHGSTVRDEPLPIVPQAGNYRPRLQQGPLTFGAPFDAAASASASLQYDAQAARPLVELHSPDGIWTALYDLLGSDAFSREFVVELAANGVAQLRFGDGIAGMRPAAETDFAATYRKGNGVIGNVGAETIACVVWGSGGMRRVRNPMAASGGVDPESLEQVRQFAPHALRKQERAVTEDDYTQIAQRNADVQRAAANLRWTGSWYTAYVTVDRRDGKPVDAEFSGSMQQYLDRFRMAGVDVAVNAPVLVPLDIAMEICVQPESFRSDVQQALLQVFGSEVLPGGQQGFFHPDQFTFGQPVYLSQLYRTAMQVAGVRSVKVSRLQRWGRPPGSELASGVLAVSGLEIVQLANDPNFPENGRLELTMRGGL